MNDTNIFLKKTKSLEITISNKNPKTVVKHYKSIDKAIISQLKNVVVFLQKNNHPYLVKLINYEIGTNFAIFEYEYFNGIPIDVYLKVNPDEEKLLFDKLLHFVRWLSYNNLYLSDLKPQHILVKKVNNELVIKFIDITPDKNWITAKWSAPEQLMGEISWKSNLYTIGLIFACRYYEYNDLILKLQNNEDLELPQNSAIYSIWQKLLNKSPLLRTDNILDIISIDENTQFITKNQNYTDFLSFSTLMCDTFYTDVNKSSIAKIFEKYCLEKSIICPDDYKKCKLPKVTYKPVYEIISQEKITPDKIYLNNKVTPITKSFENVKMAYNLWDFNLFSNLYVWAVNNLKNCHTASLNTVLWLANTFAYEGCEEKTQFVLSHYYKKNLCMSDNAAKLWITWVSLNLFSSQYLKPLVIISEKLLQTCSKQIINDIETIKKIRSYAINKKYDLLQNLFKTKLSVEFKLVIARLLATQAKMYSFFEPAINLACKQKDFYLLLDLLSLKSYADDNINMDYPLTLASLAGSNTAFALVLTRQFKLAVKHKNNSLINSIAKAYKTINLNINSIIKQDVINQSIYSYFKNENYKSIINTVKQNYNFCDASSFCYYLLSKCYNRSFKISPPITKLIKAKANSIKCSSLFEVICTYFKLFADSKQLDSFEKTVKTRINKVNNDISWFFKLNTLHKDNAMQDIISLYKTNPKLSLYNQAELNYYASLALKSKNLPYKKAGLKAINIFNKIGLLHRCKIISSLISNKNNIESNNEINFYQATKNLSECSEINQFITVLSNTIYSFLGFETCIPFIYDAKINNFSPIGNYDFNDGYKGLTYSTKVLNAYKKNVSSTFAYDAFEMSNSKSVHRLKIHKAYCVPMLSNGNFIGTLYIHTKNNELKVSTKNLSQLKLIAGISGFMLKFLYNKNNLKPKSEAQNHFHGIIGTSQSIKNVCEYISRIASFPYSVLIFGESGVGKELVARAIYAEGNYSGKMVAFNCSNLSKNLFESSLFGHVKGAFTGADNNQFGKIAEAENGVIFFDEIGELPFEMQAKLLRVLENRTFYPVGSTKELTTNARFVFATNQNLEKMVEEKTFRADLLARIKQFLIKVPALRQHLQDLPLLVKHFTAEFFKENPNIKFEEIAKSTILKWQQLSWPLNIRGLKYEVFRELINAKTNIMQKSTSSDEDFTFKVSLKSKLNHKQIVEKYVLWLKDVLGNANKVIEFLNVTPPTYYRIVNKAEKEKNKKK